jgi:hypothetical protein
MIGDYQMTLTWHVDDLKISHRDSKAVDDMVDWLRHEYEEILEDGSGEMKVTRGKVHNYLGMTLDYSVAGEVKIGMISYVKEMITEFQQHDPTDTVSATPAGEHLFKVRDDVPKLPEDAAKVFHNFTAKALFLTKRARPDIHTAVAFLTTRVKEPDEDDWKKLRRMMRYLRGTPEIVLTLAADRTNLVKTMEWWVDGSHAEHENMRGQTGAAGSLGRGSIMSTSVKQKLNTRSSTETEIVAVDDMMPKILWTNYFLGAQGYGASDTVVYQDNKSAILLESNGKASSSKRTRHIDIKFFFVKDRINSGEIRVEHCPTESMIADFFTKPLQGSLFLKFRNAIMNIKEE